MDLGGQAGGLGCSMTTAEGMMNSTRLVLQAVSRRMVKGFRPRSCGQMRNAWGEAVPGLNGGLVEVVETQILVSRRVHLEVPPRQKIVFLRRRDLALGRMDLKVSLHHNLSDPTMLQVRPHTLEPANPATMNRLKR